MTIYELLPDAEVLLQLEPEELAGYLLESFNSGGGQREVHMHNFTLSGGVLAAYPSSHRDEVAKAIVEAWVWLEREGLVAPKPVDASGRFQFITRRGQRLRNHVDVDAYRNANLLPKRLLHPIIAQEVWSLFIRGQYDTALFQAFKEVEVAVRQIGRFRNTDIGTELMRMAFQTDTGPLSDRSTPRAEQEALAHLFAGAIGSYKNPASHRRVPIDPTEAVEMIVLASHLLRIVESRNLSAGAGSPPTI